MNLIFGKDLTKKYGDKTLFENISFKMNEGQKVAIIGVNGSGKSTLLKMVGCGNYRER